MSQATMPSFTAYPVSSDDGTSAASTEDETETATERGGNQRTRRASGSDGSDGWVEAR